MPYFIDNHELNGDVHTEAIAQKHLKDITVQHRYHCRKLGYWYDEKRKIAFCLFEAPNRACIEQLHKEEHGNVANHIIEVDSRIIDFFLKQIESQTQTEKVDINSVSTQPLTTIMALSIDSNELYSLKQEERRSLSKLFKKLVLDYCNHFKGTVILRDQFASQLTFDSTSAAVYCALKIHKEFAPFIKPLQRKLFLKVGISGCYLEHISNIEFEQSVKLAKRLCYISTEKILVTLEVRNLFQSESMKVVIKGDRIKSISPDEVRFITSLMDYMEKHWKNHDLHASMLENHLGCSKSQIYRKMKALIGESPNSFIKAYRLNRAKQLLRSKSGNISEIAFDTGFGSPSYFSKCFQKEYGITPSDFQIMLAEA
ncbi:nickel-binding protein [uncultured Draconibacterium sp.]|uniref:nickel-binding protein n=1 Tax=uncultured Draconibacterium sp. TaxID=1573823 RepID=UPI0025DDBA2F|nr:nickel-binding protein [uncultured Draconibacterium sp.]